MSEIKNNFFSNNGIDKINQSNKKKLLRINLSPIGSPNNENKTDGYFSDNEFYKPNINLTVNDNKPNNTQFDSKEIPHNLINDMQPLTTKDYILKAVVHCTLGQQGEPGNENIKKAQTFYQSIGASTTECDTIEGRQCMASCFRLTGAYNDEIIYLDSIEQYMKDDDDFNWNYGVALAMCQNYKQAEEVLSRVKKEKYRNDQVYLSWLCRCYIMNDKPDLAWNLYISIENHLVAVYILNFIAHELYRMGHFYFSFKAFLFLEKFSPSEENTKGKISSAIGVFYLLLSEKISSDRLQEVIHYLCDGPQSLEVNKALKVFKTWGKENGIDFTDEPAIDDPQD
jgi:intraflagellar transport protein 56